MLKLLRSLGWILLAFSILVVYTSYVVAYTYYSATGVLVITILTIFIGGLGALEGLVDYRGNGAIEVQRARKFFLGLERINRHFSFIFAVAVLSVTADVILTLLGLERFGPGIERNRAVAALIADGAIATWLGLQYAPLGIAGSAFLVSRRASIRVTISAYVLATLVYALLVVVNNLLTLARLTGNA